MLIFPGSVALGKSLGSSGKHHKEKPLAPLALEGTLWVLLSIPLAISVALYKVEWFFPGILLLIGGWNLAFATLFGMRIYWAFGASLVAAAVVLVAMDSPLFSGGHTGAAIEYALGIAIFRKVKPGATQPIPASKN